MSQNSYNTRRRRRRSRWGRVITFLLVVIALIFGVSRFFRVGEIHVQGDTRYTNQQIITASGIAPRDQMFSLQEGAIAQQIMRELPYIETVAISRQFPNRVTIRVTETHPIAVLQTAGGYWVLNQQGKLLEQLDSPPIRSLIEIQNAPELITPQAGDFLVFQEDATVRLEDVQYVLSAIAMLGLENRVFTFDLADRYDLRLAVDGRFAVNLGTSQQMHRKLDTLVYIISTLEDHQAGTIDLSFDRPVFQPN